MKFERKYTIGVKDIGLNNKMTNYAFLSFLEEIACTHSAECGFGVNNIETKKRAWILMDWKLKVFKRPIYGEELTVKTWARPIEKHIFFTYREFEIFLGNEKIAIATSKWIHLDVEKKKICKITDEIFSRYLPIEEHVFEEEDIEKIKESEDIEKNSFFEYDVRRFDIDVNKHMHNLNYLKLAYEALPEEEFLKEEKMNTRIMYKHQILLGDKLKCYYEKKDNKNVVTIKSYDNKVLHAIVELS